MLAYNTNMHFECFSSHLSVDFPVGAHAQEAAGVDVLYRYVVEEADQLEQG